MMRLRVEAQQAPKSNEPLNASGAGVGIGLAPKKYLMIFLQHDGKAEGHQDLVGMRALVEMLDQAALHHEADQRA